ALEAFGSEVILAAGGADGKAAGGRQLGEGRKRIGPQDVAQKTDRVGCVLVVLPIAENDAGTDDLAFLVNERQRPGVGVGVVRAATFINVVTRGVDETVPT